MKAILILAVLLVSCYADIWSDCGDSSDHFTIGTVKITPDPPQAGKNLSVIATGTLDETVTSGSLYIELNYGPVTILNTTYNLCSMIGGLGISCPLNQGTVDLGVREFIPSEAPHGKYTGLVILNDQSNSQITCIKLAFTMGSKGQKLFFN